uniref:S-receptor kinase n=1 Tax=Rhizophora mucronata TaxID=61149 RepID=A0A2P2K904_RHIMU
MIRGVRGSCFMLSSRSCFSTLMSHLELTGSPQTNLCQVIKPLSLQAAPLSLASSNQVTPQTTTLAYGTTGCLS